MKEEAKMALLSNDELKTIMKRIKPTMIPFLIGFSETKEQGFTPSIFIEDKYFVVGPNGEATWSTKETCYASHPCIEVQLGEGENKKTYTFLFCLLHNSRSVVPFIEMTRGEKGKFNERPCRFNLCSIDGKKALPMSVPLPNASLLYIAQGLMSRFGLEHESELFSPVCDYCKRFLEAGSIRNRNCANSEKAHVESHQGGSVKTSRSGDDVTGC